MASGIDVMQQKHSLSKPISGHETGNARRLFLKRKHSDLPGFRRPALQGLVSGQYPGLFSF